LEYGQSVVIERPRSIITIDVLAQPENALLNSMIVFFANSAGFCGPRCTHTPAPALRPKIEKHLGSPLSLLLFRHSLSLSTADVVVVCALFGGLDARMGGG
jgi:hypothetical protein